MNAFINADPDRDFLKRGFLGGMIGEDLFSALLHLQMHQE
jgi:hypothetical protein